MLHSSRCSMYLNATKWLLVMRTRLAMRRKAATAVCEPPGDALRPPASHGGQIGMPAAACAVGHHVVGGTYREPDASAVGTQRL